MSRARHDNEIASGPGSWRARYRVPAVLLHGFRPMFLAAASWAVIALALWLAMFFGYVQLPTRFDPLSWHIHEMLFGFVMASVAGFLLTAIPNWTGRPPIRGRGLAALASLWLVGRLACIASADLPAWLAVVIDLAFPVTLLAVAAREIVISRNSRSLPVMAPLAALVIADLLMHLESLNEPVPAGCGWQLGLAAPIILIGVIGGRIVPSFTRSWLAQRKSRHLPVLANRFDAACVAVLALGFILWAFVPEHPLTGTLLIAAALLNAVRLSRWAGWLSWPEKLLFVLHVGYGWLVLGTLLLGLSVLGIGVPASSAIHALTAGAIAVMILGVMARVALGHTGRALTASGPTVAAFVLINAAAFARVCASSHTAFAAPLLFVAGVLWIAAFGLFALIYGPMLLTRRADA